MNMGQDPLFPDSADDVNPIVMNGISTGTSNHDFFSQVGNGYLLGEVEVMQGKIVVGNEVIICSNKKN
ncbi:ribonucleotide-diphosphate reductase subunit beta [Streptococcus pneumoniae]|nr:ribonucleotide-diphosphate reductase subunit beta [Streptococcus pneumoniae]